MKISVVIPCIPKHVNSLKNTLQSFVENTVQPHEVIVYMNSANKIKEQIKEIDNQFSKVLNLVIIKNKGKHYCGTSKQKGSEKATGDIIVYFDADDLVHPQLIEIVDYFFSKYDIMHCVYGYCSMSSNWKKYDLDKIEITKSQTINKFVDDAFIHNKFNGRIIPSNKWSWGYPRYSFSKIINWKIGIVNGHSVIRKEVLKKNKWTNKRRAQDKIFSWGVAKEFRKSIIIHALLCKYKKC